MPIRNGLPRTRSRNPGSQSALRQSNQQRIIQSLLAGGPTTQAELSRQTGLSTATISNIVKSMTERGLVTTEPTTSSGRRALAVSLSGNGAVSVGIDFGRRHQRVVISTLDYRVIAEDFDEVPPGLPAKDRMDAAATRLDVMLDSIGVDRTAVLGVGVGITGPIDRRTATVVEGAILPEWVGITALDLMEFIEFPVHIGNDADLGALAEVTWGPHAAVSDLVFVKVGTGIGAGLILNGKQYSGNIGITGEIGHIPVYDQGLICHCGKRGCLETVASTTIMIELLSRISPVAVTTADIVTRARAGDQATLRVVNDAGEAIGRSLATIANLVNPQVVVIGGSLVGLGEVLLTPIRQGLTRYAVSLIAETTEVVMSSLGDRGEALGAAALVLRQPGIHYPGQ
jgi:predicted NBD/HSP70 family sugar kinase